MPATTKKFDFDCNKHYTENHLPGISLTKLIKAAEKHLQCSWEEDNDFCLICGRPNMTNDKVIHKIVS